MGRENDEFITSLDGLNELLITHTKGNTVVIPHKLKMVYRIIFDKLNFIFLFVFFDIVSPRL